MSKAAYGFGIGTILYPIVISGTLLFIFGCIAAGSCLMGIGLVNDAKSRKRSDS